MVDFCKNQNIPFTLEERRFYKQNQNRNNFKLFKTTVDDLYETGRPDEFSIGLTFLDDNFKEVRRPL
jgi:uncharacterized protein (UPF0261 family)